MPAAAFLWNYVPVFRPFSPIANERSQVGRASEISGRGVVRFAAFGHQEAPVEIASDIKRAFGGDFYNRFHVSATVFALGNLVGNQTRELKIWNAYRRARILETLDLVDGEGVIISGQNPPPLQFAPLQERAYSIEITTDGPPTIEATLVFGLDGGDSISVLITGNRVTPWPWQPDWSQGVGEALAWMTEITESENGSEQATALRLAPRRSLSFGIGSVGRERQAMETAVAGWGGRVWSLPIWTDAQQLQTGISAGGTVVAAKTIGRDFYAGGLAMFTGDTARDYEVVEVLEISQSQIILKRPTVRAWPAGSMLYPARTARLSGGASFTRFTGAAHTGRVEFDLTGPCDWPELTGLPMYRGLPVLEERPEWSREPTLAITRKQTTRDNGYGKEEFTDWADIPIMRQAHRWSPVGRAKLAWIRSLLYLLRGKHRAIWVPSWADDFKLTAPAASTGTALDVEWTGYSLYTNGTRGRRDLRISTDTSVQYARIAGAVETDANTERLGLDAPLQTDLTPENAEIQFLTLWRLDTDRLEFAWWSGDMESDQAHADVPMPMRTFRHDL